MRAPVALAAVVLAAGTWVVWIPPAAPRLDSSVMTPGARGAMHVHTRRSDGSGTVEEVALAAARAGLDFVVLTDHGDATRLPDVPAYRHGVLMIDAVEVSTEDGHVVALGLPRAPYPLGGEARDVVEDIARLGGMSIAAHPDSPREVLRWRDWEPPIDGFEWINGDSAWRDEGWFTLFSSLLTYPVRPVESMARVFDRPEALMARWDAEGARRLVAVAGGDVHARLAIGGGHRRGRMPAVALPGYTASFRLMSNTLPAVRLSGHAHDDAGTVVEALRSGHVYSSIDALASPALLSFTATSGRQRASGGDVLALDGPVVLEAMTNAPPSGRIVLFANGEVVAEAGGDRLQYQAPASPVVYRVEVHLADAPGRPAVPWIVSNPIYAGWPAPTAPPVSPPPGSGPSLAPRRAAWHVESSASGAGAIDQRADVTETTLAFRYALGGSETEGPFIAFATSELDGLATYDGLAFEGWADAPMRLSVQVRGMGPAHDRWHRSVYLDSDRRAIVVWFDDMRPRGSTARRTPAPDEIEALLLVVDTVNTAIGASGRVTISDLRAVRADDIRPATEQPRTR